MPKQTTAAATKKNVFDLIEGYYISHLILYLHKKGYLDPDQKKRTVSFARMSRQDSTLLQIMTDRTDIILKVGTDGFALNPAYSSYNDLAFPIDKFLGAYGKFSLPGSVPRIKLNPLSFSRAFEKAHAGNDQVKMLGLLADLGAKNILDLGCGPSRLIELFCEKDPGHRGFGIDQNKHLVSGANGRIRKKKLFNRARLIRGDVHDFGSLLNPDELRSIDVVIASNILNEFFEDDKRLLRLLKRLRSSFKGKTLIVQDYYGVLNTRRAEGALYQHTVVHDMVQLFTGQGIPPGDHEGWQAYYEKANCTLVQVNNGSSDGISWFVHLVQLG
ncbi:methyltransferase domain-containing protein [Flavitalea flava]